MNRAITAKEAKPEITGNSISSLSAFRTCQDDLAKAMEFLNIPPL